MRILAIVVGVVLVLLPAFWVVRLFENLTLGWSLLGLLLVYGCILAGVAFQRRRGRMGGYFASAAPCKPSQYPPRSVSSARYSQIGAAQGAGLQG
jgi:hypothetical protein